MCGTGVIKSKAVEAKLEEGKKFADYFHYEERFKLIPSHRTLALFRGRAEKILKIILDLPEDGKKNCGETNYLKLLSPFS